MAPNITHFNCSVFSISILSFKKKHFCPPNGTKPKIQYQKLYLETNSKRMKKRAINKTINVKATESRGNACQNSCNNKLSSRFLPRRKQLDVLNTLLRGLGYQGLVWQHSMMKRVFTKNQEPTQKEAIQAFTSLSKGLDTLVA